MKLIKHYFQKFFEIPLPQELEHTGKLIPIRWDDLKPHPEDDLDEALLLSSKILMNEATRYLQGMESLEDEPEGSYMVGLHEYGVNNKWFFYLRVDSWRRVFFRASYGGVYQDDERKRRKFREFLPRYLAFEDQLKNRAKSLFVVESPHGNCYSITLQTGETYSLPEEFQVGSTSRTRESFIKDPNFEEKFGELAVTLRNVPVQRQLPWNGNTKKSD